MDIRIALSPSDQSWTLDPLASMTFCPWNFNLESCDPRTKKQLELFYPASDQPLRDGPCPSLLLDLRALGSQISLSLPSWALSATLEFSTPLCNRLPVASSARLSQALGYTESFCCSEQLLGCPWGCKESDTTEGLNKTCPSRVKLGCPGMFSKAHLPGSIKSQSLLCVLTPFLDATYERRPSGKFPGGPVVRGASQVWLNSRESACSTRDTGDMDSIPGLGRSPEEGHGNMLQYSCLENPVDRGAWRATLHGIAKSQTRLKPLSTHSPSG